MRVRTVIVNPVIKPLSDEEAEDWEGCLSVPGLRRVVQHECGHLIGTLYPMRIRDFTRFGFTAVLFPELTTDD